MLAAWGKTSLEASNRGEVSRSGYGYEGCAKTPG
jgi:hypothetical protein